MPFERLLRPKVAQLEAAQCHLRHANPVKWYRLHFCTTIDLTVSNVTVATGSNAVAQYHEPRPR